MNKKLSIIFIFSLFTGALLFSCSKSEGEGNAPTYKAEGTSTGNNPLNPPASTT